MTIDLKAGVRAIYYYGMNYHHHYSHFKLANRILNSIEGRKGKTCGRDIKLCDEYAVDVLGHKNFAPWLYVYSAISGEFKKGWIPDNYYGAIVVPRLQGSYRAVSALNPLNSAIFQSDLFPDLLSHANGIFFDTTYRFVPMKAVRDRLFENHDQVVFKLDNSQKGRGIHVFNRDSFEIQHISKLGNGLFQGYIKQHALFDEFQRNSVTTIRITTVYDDSGAVSVRAGHLKMGSGTETHVQSTSSIKVPFDLKNGKLNDYGFTAEWAEIKSHPISRVPFSGKVIPAYLECICAVTELHKKVPYIRCIGWDLTVDIDENVRLIEWNGGHNDIKFSEATQGPCFADLGWTQLNTGRGLQK